MTLIAAVLMNYDNSRSACGANSATSYGKSNV
jgi:hypothetical protein